MAKHTFAIRLTTDAEPGTGLGGETVNQLAPRNHQGNWVLNASHIKGLMRQSLLDVVQAYAPQAAHWTEDLLASTFGKGHDSDPGFESKVRLTDAVADTPADRVKMVTRTRIDGQRGVAAEKSLRTTESIPAGTVFRGSLYSQANSNSIEDLAWRLALSSIPAVGSNRNRGSGLCVVELEGGDRPSELLAKLDKALQNESLDFGPLASETTGRRLSEQVVVLRFTFHAETPICCPEIPDKTNVIATGFSIPASAVQGAILHRLNAKDQDLATATFNDPGFRAWPLQPCRHPDDPSRDDLPTAIRVSLTHRASKFFSNGVATADDFQDEAIKPYQWSTTSRGAPLKAADGVLVRDAKGKVRLWRGTDMPHVITSHGVHRNLEQSEVDGQLGNLFTVDSMAPMIWQGLVTMPADAAEEFQNSIQHDPIVALGKSRSVRGIGRLEITEEKGTPPEWRTPTDADHTVLVVQSPILLNRDSRDPAEEELHRLAEDWARERLDGAKLGYWPKDEPRGERRPCWANVGIRFGWRRHKISDHQGGFLRAERVILPGSVISFAERVPDEGQLCEAIKGGFYAGGVDRGRPLGFGAVCVHPGRAIDEYKFDREPIKKGSPLKAAINEVMAMKADAPALPSPSQIRAVKARIENKDVAAGRKYLSQQLERTSRIWFAWEPIHRRVDQMLENHMEHKDVAIRALDVLADLSALKETGK